MNAPHPPYSPEAELAVIAQMLGRPQVVRDVVGSMLEPQHFYIDAHRLLFDSLVQGYYDDEPIDAITIAEKHASILIGKFNCAHDEVAAHLELLANRPYQGRAVDHAKLIKRTYDLRKLGELAHQVLYDVGKGEQDPEEIASLAAQSAMQIATSTITTQEILSYADLGRDFLRHQRQQMEARKAGTELGAYFNLRFVDNYTRGLRPTELMFVAGEPGAGKSAVTWKMVQNFAEAQLKKPAELRIGAFVLSLEMGKEPSNGRLAQMATGIDGGKIREGRTTEVDLETIRQEWGKRLEIPLWFNFTSQLTVSQMRALIVEAIRRHNVGLVVIDHFKYVLSEDRRLNPLDQDEEKARFLKENIAKDLNVAVICLAHTTKTLNDDGRPSLRDLRGSYMVAAHADFVGFVYRPFNYASAEDKAEGGRVKRTDAEMIWEKNRHAPPGTGQFFFDPSTMTVR